MEKGLRYEAYVRKSTEASERQALSIPAQKAEILARFPDLNIVRWTEESRSAFKAENRPDFDAMLKRLKKGEIDGIVAWQPNRLSRNALDAGRIVHYINTGIIKDIKFVSHTFEPTPEGVKSLQYSLADSQYYSANLGRDVRRGNKAKRERGWLQHANLNGYLNAPNPNQSELDPTESITVKDPERFNLLRKAWDLLLTGEYSVPAILDILNNEWGYRTRLSKSKKRGGKPLSRTALYNIFTNPRYAGKVPTPEGELLDGKFPAMITTEEFNRAQFILGKHGKPRITPKKDFIYKGIATCGECGCSITAEYKYKAKYDKTYIYYHCTHKRGNCRQGSIEEKELTRQLEAFWNSVNIKKEFFEWGLEAIQAMNSEANAEREKIAEAQTKALSEAQKKADRLLDLVVNGTISEETYKEKVKESNETITRLKDNLSSTIESGNDWRTTMQKTLEVLFDGKRRFENGDILVKRELLQSLGSNIRIIDGQLVIDLYKWLIPIQENYKTLEKQFDEVRTSSEQRKNSQISAIRSVWRKREDSNLRDLSAHTISSRAPSTTRPRFHFLSYHIIRLFTTPL